MIQITPERLVEILESHKRWLDGAGVGVRADLRDANLRGANLRHANMRYANMSCAILQGADMGCANLRGANLRGANLRDANLRDANLRYARLDWTGIVLIAAGQWHGWADPERCVIGCQNHPHAVWRSLDEETADGWHANAWGWWQAWGPVVLAACDSCAKHGWPKAGKEDE